MSDEIANGITSLAGVAVMGAVAMKTIDVVGRGSTRRRKRSKKLRL